jgi:agmatinase
MEMIRTAMYMGARTAREGAEIVLFGCPYDGTCSFRPGARFGPAEIREVSEALETYCPVLKLDLEDIAFADIGDLPLPPGDKEKSLEMSYQMAKQIHLDGQIPAALGGEHLLSLPLIRAARERHEDLVVVQFDAHLDLRNKYLGVELSHATVMRRVTEVVDPSHILQVGQRSGTQEEFTFAESLGILRPSDIEGEEIAEWVADRPLYVTVDLDVLDPSVLPGTGTPEPGGISYSKLQEWLVGLAASRWVGWDVVELSPIYDATQVSSIVSAKVVRTMLLSCSSSRGRIDV